MTSRSEKEKKRRVVAAGIAAGKPVKAIAKAAGASKRHVERLAKEPETHLILTEALKPYRMELERMIQRGVAAVNDALLAAKGVRKTPNFDIRLKAAGRAAQWLELAQGRHAAPDPNAGKRFSGTMEDLLVLYRQVTNGPDGGSTAKVKAADKAGAARPGAKKRARH